MRILGFSLMAIALTLIAVIGSCGGKQGQKVPSQVINVQGASPQNTATLVSARFSEEDRMVMAMTLEQRITYLEQKLKEKLWERYGIRIEDVASIEKKASLVDDYNKVCVSSGGEDKELLSLTETSGKWEWTLSFLDRLSGDYNFDHVVDIDYEPYPGKGTSGLGDDWTNGSNHQVQIASKELSFSAA
jgi:hypothetical protein